MQFYIWIISILILLLSLYMMIVPVTLCFLTKNKEHNKQVLEDNRQTRPGFDEIYMNLAKLLSLRSTCLRSKVGCVIVSEDNQRVLAVGYNGSYKSGPNKCDSDEPGNCGCLHAEENAIIKLNTCENIRKILYTTFMPCVMCAKRIVNADIKEVVYLNDYRKLDGISILTKSNVKVRKL